MDQTTTGDWLIALLSPRTKLMRSSSEPRDGVEFSGERFTILAEDGISGTFDRLVDDSQTLIGIQCWPVASLAAQVRAAPIQGPLVRVTEDPATLQVYFERETQPREIASGGEQSLVGYLLLGSQGSLAVAVDLAELLSESERARVREMVA